MISRPVTTCGAGAQSWPWTEGPAVRRAAWSLRTEGLVLLRTCHTLSTLIAGAAVSVLTNCNGTAIALWIAPQMWLSRVPAPPTLVRRQPLTLQRTAPAMQRPLPLVIAVGLSVLPASISAQVCSGFTSFAHGPFQVFGSAGFNDNAKTFGGGFAFGGQGVFGQLSIGTTSFDDLDGSSFNFGGGAGYQFSLDKRSIFHLCPIASVSFSSGPNDIDLIGDGSLLLDLSETDLVFGLSFGARPPQSGKTQIIPSGSLGFVSATLKAKDQVTGVSDSETETFGLLSLGVGFVFSQVFTLRPGVAIPFGLEGGSTTFGVTLSINFGRKSE
jgi:hypothetical protein